MRITKMEKTQKLTHQITTTAAANRILFYVNGKNALVKLVKRIGACESLFVGFDDKILNDFNFFR